LKPRDANRSIHDRKIKDAAAAERKLEKQFEKMYGFKPTKRTEESIQRAIDNEREARERGEPFVFDR
jgi:hypothetical protein